MNKAEEVIQKRDELKNAVNALYVELPAAVADDVLNIVNDYIEAVEEHMEYKAIPEEKSCDNCKNKGDCRFIGDVCKYHIPEEGKIC